ncbi:MAG: flagellar assembly protein FliW [Nitrospinales bacterium]
MKFTSTRLGSFELSEDEIIHFPEGLYGFEKEKRFGILPFDQQIECPMEWMQSLQTPDLAFVVTDPNIFVPEYQAPLGDGEKEQIQLRLDDPYMIRVIVNIPSAYIEMTANLVAPIVINAARKLAQQLILTTPVYDTRHYLFPREMRNSNTSPV